MGAGIPLDAFKVDHACGAVEQAVLEQQDKEWILLRGRDRCCIRGVRQHYLYFEDSCPTHLILCHRAEMNHLRYPTEIRIPDLTAFIALNETLASVCGTYGQPKVEGIALNTSKLSVTAAADVCAAVTKTTGIPATDVVLWPRSFGQSLTGSYTP